MNSRVERDKTENALAMIDRKIDTTGTTRTSTGTRHSINRGSDYCRMIQVGRSTQVVVLAVVFTAWVIGLFKL